ncbi:unnamed protein product, partial [Porites evermanni]
RQHSCQNQVQARAKKIRWIERKLLIDHEYSKRSMLCIFWVYISRDTTALIRVFLQVNCRFQVYTTQDTTGMIRAFLQVNCRFQVYTTQDTTGMIRVFLQVNCRFQ